MAVSLATPKPTCHARSNSLPSRSHPLTAIVEDQLYRLKASESTSTSSLCNDLESLKVLHERLNDMIQLPSIQQALSHEKCGTNEVLDRSLRLLDVCGTARDVSLLTKESIRLLQSSLRRKRGGETCLADEVCTYMISRKKINKMVSKSIKNFEHCFSALLDEDRDLVAIVNMIREVETISFSVLKSVLSCVSGTKAIPKQSSWSLLSKFMQPKRVSCDAKEETNEHEVNKIDQALYALTIHKSCKDINNVLKQLQALQFVMEELEERLESIFRSLVKTRVSLLNVLSH